MAQLEQSLNNTPVKTPPRLIEGNETIFIEKSLEDPWPARLSLWRNTIALLQQTPGGSSPAWQYKLVVADCEIPCKAIAPEAPGPRDLPGDLKPFSIAEIAIASDATVQIYRVDPNKSVTPELILNLLVRYDAAASSSTFPEAAPLRTLAKPAEALALPEKLPTKGD